MRLLPVLALALIVGCSALAPTMPPAKAAKKVWERDDFRKLVMDKTPEEVIRAVGKPYRTSQINTRDFYDYHDCTRDPVTGKIDRTATVSFKNGVVISVSF